MAHQVFISHATEDRDTALGVCAALEAEGVCCWIAPRDVKPGVDYAAAILDGIRTSDLVLLMFSVDADASPYVLREIDRAVAYKRPVLALRLDDTVPSSSVEYYVSMWQRLDASAGIDERRMEIVSAVRATLAGPASKAGTRPGEARRIRMLPGWSRRRPAIGIVAAMVALAAIGLGLGLSRDRAASMAGVTPEQIVWKYLYPKGALPDNRAFHVMVQDPTSGRLILFGGLAPSGKETNDLWGYDPDANAWAELAPSGPLPPGRGSSAMAYDPTTRRIILFGGYDGAIRLGDTWAYDPVANAWAELNPEGPVPVGRAGHVMVYDPSHARMLMFGGRAGADELLNDTWAYDPVANAWTRLDPKSALPKVRAQTTMAYDPGGHRMILFGGWDFEAELGDTWAYDPSANRWNELHPTGALPPPSFAHDLVCDTSRGVLLMFGGTFGPGNFDDLDGTWAYSPAANAWTKLSVSPGTAPSRRTGHAMVYDPSSGRLIMFGGNASLHGLLNDTHSGTY